MSNFNYYLNRQGSIGRQGIKGDKGEAGYSPYIDIKSNTPTEFIMTIHNETESFDTPNLIPTAIGEKVTEMDAVLTTHTEDIANLKLDITAIKNKDNAQDSAIAALKTRVGGTEELIEDLNHKYTVLGSEVSDLTLTKQNRLVEGDNITLTDNADGTTTISASGGGGGGGSDVPIATTQVAGKVKPDGTTITITDDGTISAVGGGGTLPDNVALLDKQQVFTETQSLRKGLVVSGSTFGDYAQIELRDSTDTSKYIDISHQVLEDGSSRTNFVPYTSDKNIMTVGSIEMVSNSNQVGGNITTINTDKLKRGKFDGTEGYAILDTTSIKAGQNITIDKDEEAGTITINSSGGGGSSDVTAAGNNRFTGDNTFTGKVNIAGGALTVDGLATLNQTTAQYLNAVNITSAGEVNAVSIKANGLRSDDIQTTENKKYLTELDVDNQTIQVVNGKLHANLDELGNEVNSLTGEVNSLTGEVSDLSSRVTANEADISAIKTGKQNKLKAGTNITLTDNPDGTTTVASTGGGGGTPENMMTINTNQTVSGVKTFTNGVNIGISGFESIITPSDNSDSGQRQDLSITSSGNLTLNTGNIVTTDNDGGTHIKKGSIKDGDGNIVLTQGNITAGNNITITKTSKGIQIASSGGGGEAPANMVTTDTDQDITGVKRFLSNRQDLSKPAIKIGSYAAGQDNYDGGYITTGINNLEIGDYYAANSKGGFLSITSTADSSIFKITSSDSNINPRLQLGTYNYEGEIYNDIAEGLCLSNRKSDYSGQRSILKIKDNTLTFKKTNGTVVDLLAGGATINDDVASDTSTYSSSKIEKLTNITSSDTSITVTKSDTGVDIVANKDLVTGYAFPSNKSVTLTLGASGTSYTAPADGYVYLNKTSTAVGQHITLGAKVSCRTWSSASGQTLIIFIPVKQGTSYSASYSADGKLNAFKFIYAEGSQPQE